MKRSKKDLESLSSKKKKKKKKKEQKGLHRNYHCFHTPSHRTYIFLKMTNIEFVRFIAS